jgi:hypothetical protein
MAAAMAASTLPLLNVQNVAIVENIAVVIGKICGKSSKCGTCNA